MPDWKSEEEVVKDTEAFVKLVHSLLGLYAWEWFTTLDFEWEFLTGKKKFHWPLIFYYLNRYSLLLGLIGTAISFDTTTRLDCHSLYVFNQLMGDAAVGFASINLAIRCIVLWSESKILIGLLIAGILGHWAIILQGLQLKVIWVEGQGCQITDTNIKILAAMFIYSMCFDLIVLLLTAYKMLAMSPSHSVRSLFGRKRLAQLIFTDGLIYFIIAFVANAFATLFMLLNLNQIMSVMFNVPAGVLSTIVACRAVRRLTNFQFDGPQVGANGLSSSSRGLGPSDIRRGLSFAKSEDRNRKLDVHVQMETFNESPEIDPHDRVYLPPKEYDEASQTDNERSGRKATGF